MSALGVIVEWSVSGDGHKRGLFHWTPNTLMAGRGLMMVGVRLLIATSLQSIGKSCRPAFEGWAGAGTGVSR